MSLSRKDFDKLRRLRSVFDRNYRWTHLISDLLSYAPAIITKEMVESNKVEATSLLEGQKTA